MVEIMSNENPQVNECMYVARVSISWLEFFRLLKYCEGRKTFLNDTPGLVRTRFYLNLFPLD